MSSLLIRLEEEDDIPSIQKMLQVVFDQPIESNLISQLREQNALAYSFVLEKGQDLIGHIAFSPVSLNEQENMGLGLALVSILPNYQHQGLGAALITHTLSYLQAHTTCPLVTVAGVPTYYQRFGFVSAKKLKMFFNIPLSEEYFMVKILNTECIKEGGIIKYHPIFNLSF